MAPKNWLAPGPAIEVELGQRIGHAEIVVVVGQDVRGRVERVSCALAVSPRLTTTPTSTPSTCSMHALEIAQRRRTADRRTSSASAAKRTRLRLPGSASVAAIGMLETAIWSAGTVAVSAKVALRRRLVPGGHEAARVGILELGEQRARLALGRVVVQREQARGLLVDLAVIGEAQRIRAGLDLALERQRRGLHRSRRSGSQRRHYRRKPLRDR